MNKKTPVIKNYVLSLDVLYLDYTSEEGINRRIANPQTDIDITKNTTINYFQENGTGL